MAGFSKITIPGFGANPSTKGFAPSELAAKHQRVIDARHAFVTSYCAAKGWKIDPEFLTIDQILELRSQDGWKNAGS